MKKVALVSESEYDFEAMKNLLIKNIDNIQIIRFLNRYTGSQLGTEKAMEALQLEFDQKKPVLVILQRDLDAPESDKTKVRELKEYFSKSNKQISDKGIPLLHIEEMEALIFGDIETFNKKYNSSVSFSGNPMFVNDPKGTLKSKTFKGKKQYHENQNGELIPLLDFQKLKKINYFNQFITEFESALKTA